MSEKMRELGLHERISLLRADIAGMKFKMSGKNKYAGFNYFELKDFLPTAMKLEAKYGLMSQFDVIDELAILRIHDTFGRGSIHFQIDRVEAGMAKMEAIQKLGSQQTYLKRYLYINFLNLSEGDVVDALDQTDEPEDKQPDLASGWEIQQIRKHFSTEDDINKWLKHFKVAMLEELTSDEAKLIISRGNAIVKEQPELADKQVDIDDL